MYSVHCVCCATISQQGILYSWKASLFSLCKWWHVCVQAAYFAVAGDFSVELLEPRVLTIGTWTAGWWAQSVERTAC